MEVNRNKGNIKQVICLSNNSKLMYEKVKEKKSFSE